MDWSDQHLVYTVGSTGEQVEKMQGDPRYFVAMRLHGKALAEESAANGYPTFMRIPSRESPARPTWEPPGPSGDPWPRLGSPPKPPWESPPPLRKATSGLNELKTDWSVSLGPTAGVAAGQSPAKFAFDVNAAPSCTADYVVFPVNASTGCTRANVTGTFSTTLATERYCCELHGNSDWWNRGYADPDPQHYR